jgi:hypothetical protein
MLGGTLAAAGTPGLKLAENPDRVVAIGIPEPAEMVQ